MARIPFTLRIDAEERTALEHLSKIEGRPINQLLNEAIKTYLGQRGRKEEALAENLASLKAYRKKDPGFRRAIASFVGAEASLNDPLEGELIEESVADKSKTAGPLQKKIREVMGA
ncbi:MAG TPA: hypothetical protein VH079_10090 [Terriglobales bacterium]|jgi:hypothetical protein|nr:hypothetical protein [Terriglobales bacterium]